MNKQQQNKYRKLYYEVVMYPHCIKNMNNAVLSYYGETSYDYEIGKFNFRYRLPRTNQDYIIMFKRDEDTKDGVLMYKDDLLSIIYHPKPFNQGYGVDVDNSVFEWVNHKTNQLLKSNTYWKVMALINGTYKPFQTDLPHLQFRHDFGFRTLITSLEEFPLVVKKLMNKFEHNYDDYAYNNMYKFKKTDIKSVIIMIKDNVYGEKNICFYPSTLGVEATQDERAKYILDITHRYYTADAFVLFQNDIKRGNAIPSYYKEMYHCVEQNTILLGGKEFYNSRYTLKVNSTALIKKIKEYYNN